MNYEWGNIHSLFSVMKSGFSGYAHYKEGEYLLPAFPQTRDFLDFFLSCY